MIEHELVNIMQLIAQSHLDWLDSVLPRKMNKYKLPNKWEAGYNEALGQVKANAIKSVGREL